MEDLIEAYMSVYESFDDIEEATAMAKRGYDEAPIRQQIAKNTGGGAAADRASALEKKSTFGDASKTKQRERYARAQRGDFRNTASSNPGLHVGQHKSNDPAVKAKQAARGSQRSPLTPNERQQLNREQADFYDVVLSYLLDEGYCNSEENAITMMAAMSQDWIDSIVEEFVDPEHGETPSGRTPMQNIEDKSKRVRKKAIRGFQKQMGKEYGGNWKYVER